MKVVPTALPGVLLIEPKVFADSRGFFMETYNSREFQQATGVRTTFVQDNQSRSGRGVLRGLHYQLQHPQGKIVRAVRGSVFDVAVDLRRSSPMFGQWTGEVLSEQNHRQLWIPPGFGHGFLVLSEFADFVYKATDYDAPEDERRIAWNDASVAIDWPLPCAPLLSQKDADAGPLATAEVFE